MSSAELLAVSLLVTCKDQPLEFKYELTIEPHNAPLLAPQKHLNLKAAAFSNSEILLAKRLSCRTVPVHRGWLF